jgi:PAS domain S-box-containing protein
MRSASVGFHQFNALLRLISKPIVEVNRLLRRVPAKAITPPYNGSKRSLSSLKQALLKSEDWLQLAEQGSELGLWHWDETEKTLYWDLKTRKMFGVPAEGKITLQTFEQALHPDDRERVMGIWRHSFENGLPYAVELRAVRPDGSFRWLRGLGKGYHDKHGKPLYMVGAAFDVTARKEADQERFELSGRLINAQENERGRLARELHDDFSQRVAMLATDLETLAETVEDSPAQAKQRIRELWDVVSEIGNDLHVLSHRLHSSVLDALGLTAAIKAYCQEFEKKHAIEINVIQTKLPKSVSPEINLCVFRILQEGLRNVIKHSRASRVEVRLQRHNGTISLDVSDNGAGFDPSKSYLSNGIGIQSMRERVRMFNGTFEVRSGTMRGTQIAVTVPLKSKHKAA